MSVNEKMTAIANKIRNLLGLTDLMGLDGMDTNLGTANSHVDNQAELIAQIMSALGDKAIESGGGGGAVALPDGFAMETGIYIPAEDYVYADPEIALENTYKWMTTDKTTSTLCAMCVLDDYTGFATVSAAFSITTNNGSAYGMTFGINASGVKGNVSGAISIIGDQPNQLQFRRSSTYPIKAGLEYFWMVMGEVTT